MLKCLWCLFGTGLLLWPLSACGSLLSSGSTSPGGGSSFNTSPATHTRGPVTISTDHSRYGSSDLIQVTVKNALATPIYALDTKASCSILELEINQHGQWQGTTVAQCSLGRPAQQVRILPGHEYTATIQASTPGLDTVTFPAGTYRLVLHYATTPGSGSALPTIALPSASFVITGSGTPPPSPTTGGQGTPQEVPPPAP